ncbi:signal recognition particle-docking protein FtsY [Methanobrevibacter ruminantium]
MEEVEDVSADEDSDEEVKDSDEEKKDSEEKDSKDKKEKSGFFSFLKRGKKEDKKEDEEEIEDSKEEEVPEEEVKEASDEEVPEEETSEEESEEEVPEEEIEESEAEPVEETVEEEAEESEAEPVEEAVEEEAEETEEAKEETSEEDEEEKPKKKRSLFRRGKKDKEKDSEEEFDAEEAKGKGGFLSFIREKTISEDDVEDILFELELGLLESDVAMDVSSVVVDSVKNDLVGQKIKRSSDIEEYTYEALKKAVYNIINIEGKSMTELLEEKVAQGEPLVVMLVGINGTGKTTTIGKLANFYIKKGYTPVIAASDTFRAGAIEQVAYHADKLGVKLIKHEKGSDPAAVAFDAVQHAKAKGKELVLIDTAGRMQTNTNLMDEMKKIRRVSKPDLVVFVGDALTGNDATEQARKFNEAIDIDGVILTKADADSKGGAALSVGYIIQKPILFLGMGQSYDDIKEYDPDWMLEQIFS